MKTTVIAIAALLIVALGLNACKKDNINGDAKNLLSGAYITLDSTINTNLDFSNPDATVSIMVSKYGDDIASVNIYLATGASSSDTAGWKLIKAISYTGDGTVLQVSTADIAAALAPDAITPGTQYKLENEVVTTDGRKYSDANTPTSYSSFPAYKMAFSWPATAVCPYSAEESAGKYEVVQDDWADYDEGAIITVNAGPGANQINFQGYPSPDFGTNTANTVVDIDPATGAATVSKQATGDYDGTSAEVEGTGFVFSCTGVVTLTMTVYYGGVPYEGLKFALQKQ